MLVSYRAMRISYRKKKVASHHLPDYRQIASVVPSQALLQISTYPVKN